MEEREIPPHFICPISLQLMRDPVTIPTGITYDREHIERWILTSKKPTCPVTKQPIIINGNYIITPNHTLNRLIHSWCTHHGIDHQTISHLVADVGNSRHDRSGAFMKVASMIIMDKNEEALGVLSKMDPPKNDVNTLLRNEDDLFVTTLMGFLRSGSRVTREHAVRVLRLVYAIADPNEAANAKAELFVEITNLIKQREINENAKGALKLLIGLSPWGKNRVKGARAGAVSALVEFLMDADGGRSCEVGLIGLEQLCKCAEGRADLIAHPAGLAVVSKKMMRTSQFATDRATRILSSISRYSATGRVLAEMLQVGVVAKLCLLVQLHVHFCSPKSKDRAKQILRLHSRAWNNSPCIPPHLLSAYPS